MEDFIRHGTPAFRRTGLALVVYFPCKSGENVDKITRRYFVATVGAVTVVVVTSLLLTPTALGSSATEANAPPVPDAESDKSVYLFFNSAEARFIEAACERLIPADKSGPGALDAGVPHYLDKQLAGAWGAGERLYRSGPWQPGTQPQGYQLPFTPAELFHTALRAIIRGFEARGTLISDLPTDAQDAYLRTLEAGGQDLDGVPSAVFFDLLLKMSVEGFFSDPVCGGNRDRVAWRMIGFPGAYAESYTAIPALSCTAPLRV